jgi:hypothetical protein
MIRQKIIAGLLAICVPLVALGAERTVDVNGQLTGATGVRANGAFWDVVFYDGAWEFFPGEDLPAKSKSQADAFGQALLDQVFIDEERGTFDSDPETTNGCENTLQCIIHTPYLVDDVYTYFSLTFNQRAEGVQDDFVRDIEGVLGREGNFSDATNRVLARWTPSSNEPNTYSGDFTATSDTVSSLSTISGSWSFSFDASQVTGSGTETFVVNGFNSFAISPNPFGTTVFDEEDVAAELTFSDGNLSNIVVGGEDGTASVVNIDPADFYLFYGAVAVGSGLLLNNLWSDGSTLLFDTNAIGSFSVGNLPTNTPPTADAGADQSARAGDTIILDGTSSFDDNTATPELVPSWTIVSAPPGSATALVDAGTLTPSLFIDESGIYEVELTVTDASGLVSIPDTIVISAVNLAPTANAGPDQLTYFSSTVVLDGSSSFDPEGDAITYDWLVTSPSGVELSLTGAQPSLTVVEEGDYSAELTVSDFLGPGTTDTAVVMVAVADDFAQLAVLRAYDIVSALDVADVTTKGNQNALSNFFVQAVRSIQKGNIADAIEKLENALSRTDGCTERGAPDQGNGENERDWIVNCSAQVATYSEISGALAALRSL